MGTESPGGGGWGLRALEVGVGTESPGGGGWGLRALDSGAFQ